MISASSTTIVSFPELGWGPWTLKRFLVEDLFGKISIAWYGVIICFAMILACAIILRIAVKKEGFNFDSFLDYFIFTIPIGVVGARTMYVLARLEEYDSFSEMIAIWNGGLAIYGGVIAGALTLLVVSKIKKQSTLKVYDTIVPGLLIAQSLGRWGNFINGEAYGDPDIPCNLPWGMMVDGEGPVHPTFLYESIITFVGFLLATFVVYRFKKVDGQVFAFYLVWYGVGRTLVEGLRTDSLMIGSLRLAQCIGIASALAGIALFVILGLFEKPREAAAAAAGDGAEEIATAAEENSPVTEGEAESAPVEKPKKEKKPKKSKKKKEEPSEEATEEAPAADASEEKTEEGEEENGDSH